MSILVILLTLVAFAALLIFLALLAYPVIFNKGIRHSKCSSNRKLNGKTTLVTGASAGIGKETARDFAARGARVIMACVDLDRASLVADDIIKSTGNSDVVVYKIDTSSMTSVRQCAAEVLSKESRLDILVNNAGIGGHPKHVITDEGFELTMATNYFGHFLLTNLLLGLMKKSSPARIVTVSSNNHKSCQNLDTRNLNFKNPQRYGQLAAYNQSKLCNILFSNELARILSGSGVTATSLAPGVTATEIFTKSNKMLFLVAIANYFTAKTATEGAQTTVYAAVSEETENLTGKYFFNLKPENTSKLSMNAELAKELWDASARDVGLKPHEVHY